MKRTNDHSDAIVGTFAGLLLKLITWVLMIILLLWSVGVVVHTIERNHGRERNRPATEDHRSSLPSGGLGFEMGHADTSWETGFDPEPSVYGLIRR